VLAFATNGLVGALGLDVTGLLALVASALAGGLLGAVTAQVAYIQGQMKVPRTWGEGKNIPTPPQL
jgi:hypothetical protein